MNETDQRIAALEQEVRELRSVISRPESAQVAQSGTCGEDWDDRDVKDYVRRLTFVMFKNVMKWSVAVLLMVVLVCLLVAANAYWERYWF